MLALPAKYNSNLHNSNLSKAFYMFVLLCQTVDYLGAAGASGRVKRACTCAIR
jgi:hypothetical protein